ncbi:hypothetical protein AX15_005553 [Amanita polypyramis BW_CC]|nr:hypothetical protein AX15_005553 [Amanita polypyramis BW_CC]
MTRTERASYPRAIMRDRSLSRSGLGPQIRKGGAGRHNWGDLEYQALGDEERELEELPEEEKLDEETQSESKMRQKDTEKPGLNRTGSSMSEEELQQAMNIRKNALKKDIDLATIARTSSAVSSSPPSNDPSAVTTPSSL